MNVLTFAVVALCALAVLWLLGGLLLRIGGLLLALGGGLGVGLAHNANGLLVIAIGVVLWLAGHWHYALRHHEYKSPLAGYVFMRWAPAWLDPTRGWAIPVAEGEAVGSERRPR
jgi:4-amino-4-deoxy-L-arabinose transferase-like glycosyltransferase